MRLNQILFIGTTFLILIPIFGYAYSPPLVCLQDNQCVSGVTMNATKTRKFDAFFGIPFAKPPVGDLRFADPQPPEKWNGTISCDSEKPMCLQKNVLVPNPTVTGNEDCLYLNVYRPRTARGLIFQKKLPVMIFIHYGGLFSGAITPLLLGPEYFMETGTVILVMMQYRLGSLGFLSTGDSECPGNFGFKDQTMAMKWVKNHIENFGGNPNSVTIFGQSAGAVPNAENLNSSKIVEELRKVNAKSLVESSDKMKFWSVDPIVLFRTVIEPAGPSAFISENPIDTVRTGNYKHVPWMMGLVPNEGTVRATAILTNDTDLKELNNRFDELMPELMQINVTREELADYWPKVKDFYFNGQSYVNDTNWQRFVDIYSHRAFYHPFYKTVQAYISYADIEQNPIYLYKFAYKGNYSYSMLFTGTTKDYGVGHCDDLIYLFNSPVIFPKGLSEDSLDEKMKNILVRTYVTFAMSGRPKEWTAVPACQKIHSIQFVLINNFPIHLMEKFK
uniref:Carboxylic ester hydrolase n=1 Tax=Phlebotomus papatasi TaxID=29031 RepID=A0A1B0DFL8_PHLPP